jgi:hypothetical protein
MAKVITPLNEDDPSLRPPEPGSVAGVDHTHPDLDAAYGAHAEKNERPQVDLSTLYPTAIKPGDAPGSSRSASIPTIAVDGKAGPGKLVSTLITILGVLVILGPVLSPYVSYAMSTLFYGASAYLGSVNLWSLIAEQWRMLWVTTAGGTLALIYMAAGVGIILRKESARIALIVLSIITIVTSLYSFVSYMQMANSYSTRSSSQQQSTDLFGASNSSRIVAYSVTLTAVSVLVNAAVIVLLTRRSVRAAFR